MILLLFIIFIVSLATTEESVVSKLSDFNKHLIIHPEHAFLLSCSVLLAFYALFNVYFCLFNSVCVQILSCASISGRSKILIKWP